MLPALILASPKKADRSFRELVLVNRLSRDDPRRFRLTVSGFGVIHVTPPKTGGQGETTISNVTAETDAAQVEAAKKPAGRARALLKWVVLVDAAAPCLEAEC